VRRASLSPDGTIAITGELNDIILIWNVDTGEILQTIEPTNNAEWIEFNADGSQWLYSTTDDDLFIVDFASGDIIHQFDGIADFARYTPDGTGVLVVNSKRAFIIDLETGEQTVSFDGHDSEIFSVDFSADGANLITGSSDGTIRLWDLATGRELRSINVGTEVYIVATAPGENQVLSGNYTLRLWDITPPTQADIVTWANNNRYIRPLTGDECTEYRIQSCIPQ
jgi:WD40 repeat protein